METEFFTQIGMGGIVTLLIIKEIFTFLKTRLGSDERRIGFDEILALTRDLHEWHKQKDSDGVFIWYVRQSLEDAIVKLSENISLQTEMQRDQIFIMKEMRQDIKEGR